MRGKSLFLNLWKKREEGGEKLHGYTVGDREGGSLLYLHLDWGNCMLGRGKKSFSGKRRRKNIPVRAKKEKGTVHLPPLKKGEGDYIVTKEGKKN